jgi:hypothetical protein
MYITHKRNEDPNRYNEPVSISEVVAVFVGENGEPPVENYIWIFPRTGRFQEIGYNSPWREPFMYPLFHPNGELDRCLIGSFHKRLSRK